MTVADLIEALRKFPPSMGVFVEGYESGFNPVGKMGVVIVRETPGVWYDGEYDTVHEDDQKSTDEQALVLYR